MLASTDRYRCVCYVTSWRAYLSSGEWNSCYFECVKEKRQKSKCYNAGSSDTHARTQLLNQLSQPAEQSDAERTEFSKHPLHSWNAQRRFFNSFTLFSAHIIETSSCQAGQSEHSTLNWRWYMNIQNHQTEIKLSPQQPEPSITTNVEFNFIDTAQSHNSSPLEAL